MRPSLSDALAIHGGIVCAVGAGGKKSTLYRLLESTPGRIGLTASVMSAPPSARRVEARLFAGAETLQTKLPAMAAAHRRVAFAQPSTKAGRIKGLPVETIAQLHQTCGFALTLVKADGARMRGIKAPRVDEPQIIPGSQTVIFVVSAQVIGQRLEATTAHRLPELCELLEAKPNERITSAHIGRLLSEPRGAQQNVGAAALVGLINQVDNAHWAGLARQAADSAMQGQQPPTRVVLGSMTAAEPVCDIVTQQMGEAH